MPRFTKAMGDCIKAKMLQRLDTMTFSDQDVQDVARDSGLSEAQIKEWIRQFRFRYGSKSREEIDAYLRNDEKVQTNRVTRIYVSCFNVSPYLANTFMFPMPRGDGEFVVKYMEAAFDREAQSGEFFIEFQTYIQDTKLVERFVELGAGEVCSITFGKDQGISALDALRRVQASQNKTGIKVTRGSCSKQMQDRLEDKEQTVKDVEKEIDEKTAAAIQFSLKTIGEDMHSQVVKLDGIQSQVVKLEKIENDVQLQAADVVDIKHGVCGVIPDYQKKITNLEEALAHKTKLCDRIEGQKGRLTMEINKLKWEVGELNDKATSLQLQNSQQNKKIQELQEQLDICKSIALLKQTHEELQRTAEILASTLEEERAAKRARA